MFSSGGELLVDGCVCLGRAVVSNFNAAGVDIYFVSHTVHELKICNEDYTEYNITTIKEC